MDVVIRQQKNRMMILSALLIIIGFLCDLIKNIPLQNLAFIAATMIAAVPILMKVYQSLRMKTFSIELLVMIAVVGAIFIHEYTEASIVTLLFLLGDYLETRTLEKTRSSIKELLDMAPKEAIVIRSGSHIIIPAEEVVKGDRVVIRSGSKIPVDGKIYTGQALLNEASITGESVSVSKTVNDQVFSGTIVDHGYIEMIAEKVGEDTTFAKMIELVEEAQESKTKTEKFLNKFANFYTPSVVILAILVFVLTRDLQKAITFLVIACPGALVIGPPVSNVAGIGNGAKHGVLVKGIEPMERFAKVDTFVFDKTGTLTRGKPEVTEIKTFQTIETNELLRLVAQAEAISEHYLGQTIVNEAKARNLKVTGEPECAEVLKGSGIRAKVEGRAIVIGNRHLMNLENIVLSNEMVNYAVEREKTGNTAIFAAVDGNLAGIFSIADQIREDAPRAIEEMRANGIKRIIMLTGDNQYTAELVAKRLGLDEYYAELLPEDKVNYVNKLKAKGFVVGMAGDGINDAPAIASADIGLAMGAGGTDLSKETADIVLMADQLTQLSHAYTLSKATVRNIKQNTFFAVGIVFVLLFGVLNGTVHLASGMFIHQASVLLVILNAMRLIKFHRKNKKAKIELQVTPA